MSKKFYIPIVIILVMAGLIRVFQPGFFNKNVTSGKELEAKVMALRNRLSITRHARCRMECRQIDESDIQEILQQRRFNHARTTTSNKGISVPLEGRTRDGQEVRIVVSPKKNKLVLVTVIDLRREWSCDCP